MKNLNSFRCCLTFFLILQACGQQTKVQSPSRFLNQTSIPSEDWIQCKRTTENFRQFCKIRENEQIVTKILSLQGNRSPSQDLILNGIFSAGHFEDKPQNSGLQPHVKFSLDWDGSATCWKGGLTNPDMQIHINGNKVGLASTHVRDYSFPIRSWNFAKIGEEVQISVPFKFLDGQGQAEDPEKYPLQCKMVVSDLRIDFDAVQVRKSLNVLKGVAESTSINLTLTTILHNKILNQSRNLTCLLSRTMGNLKLGENVRNYEELSLGSKSILVSSADVIALGNPTKYKQTRRFEALLRT
jgi:hypothetical protein